jgi:hypothetical protein
MKTTGSLSQLKIAGTAGSLLLIFFFKTKNDGYLILTH